MSPSSVCPEIRIAPPEDYPAATSDPTDLPDGTVGTAYSQTFSAKHIGKITDVLMKVSWNYKRDGLLTRGSGEASDATSYSPDTMNYEEEGLDELKATVIEKCEDCAYKGVITYDSGDTFTNMEFYYDSGGEFSKYWDDNIGWWVDLQPGWRVRLPDRVGESRSTDGSTDECSPAGAYTKTNTYGGLTQTITTVIS